MTGTSGITSIEKKGGNEGSTSGLVTATGFTVDHLGSVINFVLFMVLTHSPTHSLTHLLTHSLTYSLTYSLIHSPTQG